MDPNPHTTDQKHADPLASFSGGLAHDLGNVLTPIMWTLDSLGSAPPADPTALAEDLSLLRTASGQAMEFVKDLQAIGRHGTPPLSQLDPSAILDSWLRGPEAAEQKAQYPSVAWNIENQAGGTALFSSETHLCRLFRALFTQCAQSAGENGQFNARTIVQEGHWILEANHSSSEPPEEKGEEYFHPFGAGRTKGKIGTGLCLAVARAITLDLKGSISARSDGQQTAILLAFPLVEAV